MRVTIFGNINIFLKQLVSDVNVLFDTTQTKHVVENKYLLRSLHGRYNNVNELVIFNAGKYI